MKRRRLGLRRAMALPTVVAALAATAALGAVPGQAASASASASGRGVTTDDWVMYHYNEQRQGYDPNAAEASGSLSSAWQTTLDGAVYAEPLVVNDEVIAAT